MSKGIAAEIAGHLAVSAAERVYRRDLRRMLPPGVVRQRRTQGVQNNVGTRFRDALREFERQGWVRRDGESVVILDRGALWEYAQR